MCDITADYNNEKEFIGYKIVAKSKKDNTYHSVYMGCQYSNDQDIPIVKKQNALSHSLNHEILSYFYSTNMVGRTAAFVNVKDALCLLKRIDYYETDPFRLDYGLKIVKVKLTKELMSGNFTISYNKQISPVVAGKHMEILEEIEV